MDKEAAVLGTLRAKPRDWHVLDITGELGLSPGTIYPILARLEKNGQVASRWSAKSPARRRRVYWAVDR